MITNNVNIRIAGEKNILMPTLKFFGDDWAWFEVIPVAGKNTFFMAIGFKS